MKLCVINGPNLNKLGQREPEIYGDQTLEDIQAYTESKLKELGYKVDLEWFQSNIEGEIVDKIQSLTQDAYEGLVINPAAYTHTSIAIYDALKLLQIPVVEVHLSNTHARESFRSTKLTSKAATTIMEGLKDRAYLMGILSHLVK